MPVLNVIKIDNLELPELKVYTTTSEVQLLRCNEPDPGVFIAESPNVISRALDAGYSPISFLADTKFLREYAIDKVADTMSEQPVHQHASAVMNVLCRGGDVPIYTADADVLDELTGFHLTSGLVCVMKRRPLPQISKVCAGAKKIVLLEGITNPANIGAVFRSAAALNMDAVLLTRDCSDPLYRRSVRVSMGTVFQIPWTILDKHISYPKTVIDKFHSMGFKMAAMVLCDDSVDIDDARLAGEDKLVIALGSEGDGLKKDTIAECDYKVRIPMSHGVDSLNVAAASAVAFWQLGRHGKTLQDNPG